MAASYEQLKQIAQRRYGQSFLDKVNTISARLKIHPSWLLAIMNNESGMNHRAYNHQGGATGLIQIMPNTATGLGTTTQALMNMSALSQLDYVEKYFLPYRGRLNSVVDMYIINFYPYALGKSNGYILGSEQSDAYARKVGQVNGGFDLDKNGYVTLGEVRRYVTNKYGTLPGTGLGFSTGKVFILSGVLLLLGVAIVYYFRRQIFQFYREKAELITKTVKN